MKTIRLLAALLLITGAALIARDAYMHVKANLAAVLIRRAWAQSVQTGKAHSPWPWADTYPVARLTIPRLGYDEFVLEGATPRTLAFGPAHLLSGARLGEPGNLVVAGHRTSWFRPLENISQGDTIQIQWFDSRGGVHQRVYLVSDTRVVQPRDVTPLMMNPDDSLTLITCYPFGLSPHSPERFVVRASPISGSSSRPASANAEKEGGPTQTGILADRW